MTTSGTRNDKEWQPMTSRVRRMTMRETTDDKQVQRMAINDNE